MDNKFASFNHSSPEELETVRSRNVYRASVQTMERQPSKAAVVYSLAADVVIRQNGGLVFYKEASVAPRVSSTNRYSNFPLLNTSRLLS